MGYYSEVGYKIKFDEVVPYSNDTPDSEKQTTSRDLFNIFVAEAKTKDETKLCFDDDDFEIDEKNLFIKFYAEAVKWYDDYADVQCHEALLELADDYITQQAEDTKLIGSCIRWGFVRIGEENDDIDERHNNDGYELVYLTRGIDFG
jgi:hypothetical protein